MYTPGRFSPCFTREITFATSCLVYCTSSPFQKRIYFKREEFAPKWEKNLLPSGSKFFSFKVDPFSEIGCWLNNCEGVVSHESSSMPLTAVFKRHILFVGQPNYRHPSRCLLLKRGFSKSKQLAQ